MDVFIGIDVAKEAHWARARDRDARVPFNQAADNDPASIGALIDRIEGLEARSTRKAVDMPGGAASLLCAMLAEARLPLVHRPGLAVNRARQGSGAANANSFRRTRPSSPNSRAEGPTCARWTRPTRPTRRTRSTPGSVSWSAAAASSSPCRPGAPGACATLSAASFRRRSGASTPRPARASCFSATIPRPETFAPPGRNGSRGT